MAQGVEITRNLRLDRSLHITQAKCSALLPFLLLFLAVLRIVCFKYPSLLGSAVRMVDGTFPGHPRGAVTP